MKKQNAPATKVSVTTMPCEKVRCDALVILHEKDGALALPSHVPLRQHVDAFVHDVEAKKSKAEWFCTLDKNAKCAAPHLLLESATFGSHAPHDEPLKIAASRAVGLCRKHSLSQLAFAVEGDAAPAKAAAILEGAMLGDFVDDRFKGEATKRAPLALTFVVPRKAEKAVKAALDRHVVVVEGQNTARQLINAPHHVITPQALADHARALARKYRLGCQVLDEKQLRRQGFNPIVEVGRGSEYPPRMIVLRYQPRRVAVRRHIALVGKGVTFDTGGLCIKTRDSMYTMNSDMSGAAAVLGAMEAIARLKLPVRITAIVGAAHNAVDGAAFTPGCIIRARNGKTIHVENTDAEGRLVLSDCFFKAGEEKADDIWDFATLTGAVSAALGESFAGLFCDDEELRETLLEAGRNSGDELWPLPLVREYEPTLRHHLADLNNMSAEKRAGGIHAANFLKQFVPDGVRWAHIDMAGTATTAKRYRYFDKGARGFGVRLILEALRKQLDRS